MTEHVQVAPEREWLPLSLQTQKQLYREALKALPHSLPPRKGVESTNMKRSTVLYVAFKGVWLERLGDRVLV